MSELKNKRLFLVLGMHRSGTSAIARGLMTLGAELGDHLLGPIRSDNEKGFFEDLDIQALNDAVMRHFGRDWHAMAPIPEEAFASLPEPFFAHARQLLQTKTGPHATFAFKDPRVVRLLPFWRRVLSEFEGEVSCVIAVRHPLSVAKSLQKRNGTPILKGLYLWQLHTLAALTGGDPTWRKVVVDYDLLMSAPADALARVARGFGVQPPSPEALKAYTGEFLEDGMRHTQYGADALAQQELVPPGLAETYALTVRLARDEIALSDAACLERLKALSAEIETLTLPVRTAGKVVDLPALVIKGGHGEKKLEYRPDTDDQATVVQIFQTNELNIARLPRVGELVALVERNRAAGRRPLIVDAHADIGTAALFFTQLFPDASIVSVEPDFENFELLCRNVAGFNVVPLHATLASSDGRLAITMDDILRRHGDGHFPFLAHLDLRGDERTLFSAPANWIDEFPLVIFKPNDHKLPGTASAQGFLRAIGALERDFMIQADRVYSIANSR